MFLNVTSIEGAGDDAVFIRPIYWGKAFEKVKVKDGVVLVSIRPNNIAPLEKAPGKTGDVSSITVDITNLRSIIKEGPTKSSEGVCFRS
ncbi:Electron transfer flavoprotein subunit alpha OS=Lysinibacillus sphaericus OX=1421 GN=LS41612_06730 PE=3 SV=1 [Lysinibacillus sphaericus]